MGFLIKGCLKYGWGNYTIKLANQNGVYSLINRLKRKKRESYIRSKIKKIEIELRFSKVSKKKKRKKSITWNYNFQMIRLSLLCEQFKRIIQNNNIYKRKKIKGDVKKKKF